MGDDDKKKEEKKKEKEEGEDERLEYILNYLIKSMRMKMDKWAKMISTEEYKVRTFRYSKIILPLKILA